MKQRKSSPKEKMIEKEEEAKEEEKMKQPGNEKKELVVEAKEKKQPMNTAQNARDFFDKANGPSVLILWVVQIFKFICTNSYTQAFAFVTQMSLVAYAIFYTLNKTKRFGAALAFSAIDSILLLLHCLDEEVDGFLVGRLYVSANSVLCFAFLNFTK